MRFAKFFLLFSVLVAAAACAPKQKEAAEPSALDVIFSRKSVRSYTDQAVTDAQIETLRPMRRSKRCSAPRWPPPRA